MMEKDVLRNRIFEMNRGDIVCSYKRELCTKKQLSNDDEIYMYRIVDIVTNLETNITMICFKELSYPHRCYVENLEHFYAEVDHEKYPKVNQKYRFV